jgi:hypothetical protein
VIDDVRRSGMIAVVVLRLLYLIFLQVRLWVPESRLTAADLLRHAR